MTEEKGAEKCTTATLVFKTQKHRARVQDETWTLKYLLPSYKIRLKEQPPREAENWGQHKPSFKGRSQWKEILPFWQGRKAKERIREFALQSLTIGLHFSCESSTLTLIKTSSKYKRWHDIYLETKWLYLHILVYHLFQALLLRRHQVKRQFWAEQLTDKCSLLYQTCLMAVQIIGDSLWKKF